jgi:hypothetical protein
MPGRKPDFWLKAMNKQYNEKSKVGAGWKNADGSISIDLNPFVVLSAPITTDLVLTLFPIDRSYKGENNE